jgi:hypothetical protein
MDEKSTMFTSISYMNQETGSLVTFAGTIRLNKEDNFNGTAQHMYLCEEKMNELDAAAKDNIVIQCERRRMMQPASAGHVHAVHS